MSSSTVSITANLAATPRRRPVVVADKKHNPELFYDVAASPIIGRIADYRFIGGKDMGHSIPGEAVPDKSRELRKSQLPGSNAVPARRTKRASLGKQKKPKWQTVLSIFLKNSLLLLVLFALFQMVKKLVVNSRTQEESGFTDMEARIAEVNSLLKSVTKMVQLRIDAADKVIEGRFWSLRTEMNTKIEERSRELEVALRRLADRGENLEKAVSELSFKAFLPKDNFIGFYGELGAANVGVLGHRELTLDEISVLARDIVEKEIQKHSADGLGRVDHALASGGARVVKHSDALAVKGSNWLKTLYYGGVHENAENMLRPSFGEPGQCFALKGTSGYADVRLRAPIVPEAITLEHFSKNVAYDRTSAPKDCQVLGWLQAAQSPYGNDDAVPRDAEKMLLLTEFTYDLEKSNAQTFQVYESAGSAVIDTVRFVFTSNHGKPSFTCVCRLRVHGVEANSLTTVVTGP